MYQGETNEVVKEFRAIKQEYAFNPDIMSTDDPRVAALKEIIDTKLSQVDKTIILLYCDCQSYRELGKKMKLSHMTIRREVLRIKKIILEEYCKMKRDYEFTYKSDGVKKAVTIKASNQEDAERIFRANFGKQDFNCREK